MVLKQIFLLPVALAILLPVSFIISYGIAISDGHIVSGFPYISDTGTLAPESCIFGQLLNIGAMLLVVCVYLRHRHIKEYHKSTNRHHKLSHFSMVLLVVGCLSAFGGSLVANFQETRWLTVHIIGALTCFVCGLVYCWGQTLCTFLMSPHFSRRWMGVLRLVLSILSTAGFIATNQCKSFVDGPSGSRNTTFPLNERPGDPGFASDVCSAGGEWGMMLAFMVYFATFAVELRHAVLRPPKILLRAANSSSYQNEYHEKTNGYTIDRMPNSSLYPSVTHY